MESFRNNLWLGKQGVSALLGMAVIYVVETVKLCMEQFPSAPTDYSKIAMMISSPCCHVSGGHGGHHCSSVHIDTSLGPSSPTLCSFYLSITIQISTFKKLFYY